MTDELVQQGRGFLETNIGNVDEDKLVLTVLQRLLSNDLGFILIRVVELPGVKDHYATHTLSCGNTPENVYKTLKDIVNGMEDEHGRKPS